MTEWETFCDASYYYMWRVRRNNERHFDDGFHLYNREEAQALVELLNKLERERDEAREELKITQEAWVKAKAERVEALRERDEAREDAQEQSRLLGMSGEREAKLLAQLAAERALADRLASILRLYHADDTIAHLAGVADALEAWKEARND